MDALPRRRPRHQRAPAPGPRLRLRGPLEARALAGLSGRDLLPRLAAHRSAPGDLASLVGGLDARDLEASRHFLAPPPTLGEEHLPALVEPPALRAAARALTWATALLEAALALLFLVPSPARWRWLPHAALLAFCAGTYAVAPVESFGWLLLAMGAATCPANAAGLRGGYLACFALLVVYDAIPVTTAALGRLPAAWPAG